MVSAKPISGAVRQPTRSIIPTLPDLQKIMYHCQYCNVTCNRCAHGCIHAVTSRLECFCFVLFSQRQWDEHCSSMNHMFNVNSDKEHQWNFRQPPWGVSGDHYQLCAKLVNGDIPTPSPPSPRPLLPLVISPSNFHLSSLLRYQTYSN